MTPKELKIITKEKNDQMREIAEQIVNSVREAIFELPEAEAVDYIAIQGYTPEFNDGNACEFTSNEDYPDILMKDDEMDVSDTLRNQITKYTELLTPNLLSYLYENNFELQLYKTKIKKTKYDCGY